MFNQWLRRLALLSLVAVLIGFGFVLGTTVLSTTAATQAPTFLPQQDAPTAQPINDLFLTDRERRLADIYTRVSPSVVSINVTTDGSENPFFDDEFGFGSGSGFVLDTQGHIITNNHVVDGATNIEVNFFDGTIVRADVVGVDPDADIAVVKVELPPERLVPVEFGDSSKLVIGQNAIAIGSPFGQRWTLTSGIVSALDRTISGLSNFSIGSVIQTDAAINPGNSGGPLLNIQGQVIGVNTQIISRTRSSSGIGFAVPSNLVQRVARDLIDKGEVNYSYLGIVGSDVDLALIEAADLPNNLRGVVVDQVETGAPAHSAGLESSGDVVQVNGLQRPQDVDIITAIDGTTLSGMSSLISYLASNTQPGDTVTATVYRDGEFINLPITLVARPGR